MRLKMTRRLAALTRMGYGCNANTANQNTNDVFIVGREYYRILSGYMISYKKWRLECNKVKMDGNVIVHCERVCIMLGKIHPIMNPDEERYFSRRGDFFKDGRKTMVISCITQTQ